MIDRIRYMVTFARVVQAGSFVGAGERLHMRASVVSKHVAKLEKDLGVKLLHRTTRSLSLTEAGGTFFDHCLRIVDEVEQSERALAQLQAEPQGHLRMTTTSSLCTCLLADMIPAFQQQYPAIQLDITASDHVVNLVEEGYDLALRITGNPAENLVARKLAPVTFSVCGSPGYFAENGRPDTIEQLSEHQCITYPYVKPGQWTFFHNGRRMEIPVSSALTINSFDAVKKLVMRDAGLGLLPNYVIAKELLSGDIECILPDYRGLSEADLYAVYLPNRFGSPTVKAFVEFLADYVTRLEM